MNELPSKEEINKHLMECHAFLYVASTLAGDNDSLMIFLDLVKDLGEAFRANDGKKAGVIKADFILQHFRNLYDAEKADALMEMFLEIASHSDDVGNLPPL